MSRLTNPSTIVELACAAAIAAAAGSAMAMANKADDMLNIAFDASPATLDAYKESDRPGLALGRMVFSGLTQKNQDTGEFGPAIAGVLIPTGSALCIFPFLVQLPRATAGPT